MEKNLDADNYAVTYTKYSALVLKQESVANRLHRLRRKTVEHGGIRPIRIRPEVMTKMHTR